MANIKVTLELEDKDYVRNLKAAEAQTRALGTAGATAGAAGAAGIGTMAVAMRGLQAATMAAMTAMAPLLAAVVTLQTVGKAFTLGDDISDLAAGSGIAAEKIIALRGALAASGGDADGAARMITKLTNNLQEATEMGSNAQKNMLKLGFSLEDIKTMTPEQALQKTINGLAGMQDPVERNALAFDLLGKNAANIDWANVAEGTATTTDAQRAQAEAARRVGEAFDAIGATFNSVMLSLMELLAPFADLITDLAKTSELGGVVSGVFTVLKGVFAATAVVAYGVAQTIIGLIDGIYSLGKAGAQVLTGDLSGASATFNGMLGRQEARLKKTGDFAQKQWQRIVSPGTTAADTKQTYNRAFTDKKAEAEAAKRERLAEREAELRAAELDKAQDLTLEIGNQTEALQRKFESELASIGLSDRQRALAEQLRQVDEKRREDIVKIQQLQRLTAEEQAAAIAEINNKYAEQTREITKGNEELAKRRFVNQEISNFVKTDLANMVRQRGETDKLLAQQRASRAATEPERQSIMELFELRRQYNEQIFNLDQERQKSTDQIERDQLRVRIGNLRMLLKEEEGYLAKTQETRAKIYEQSRTFSEGLDQAMIKFAETVTDNAAYAGRIFDTMAKGFTDSIMNFVETGKLSFKDLFKSLMAEIIKMQVNKFFLSIFGKGGPVGSLFAGLFADGGYIPSGKFGIVGEAGPEFVRGPATVTSARDTAAIMGAGGGMTAITYNINATDARSFKELVASDPAFIYNVTRLGARRMPR